MLCGIIEEPRHAYAVIQLLTVPGRVYACLGRLSQRPYRVSLFARYAIPMTTGIYAIVNTKNKKRYIGSAVNVEKRWREHLCTLRSGKHHSRHLQAAWNRYGEAAFRFDVVTTCEPQELVEQEQFWIDAFQTAEGKHGYNVASRAGSTLGVKASDETKTRLSQAHMGKRHTEEAKTKTSKSLLKTWSLQPERRTKLSEWATGRKHTEQAKARMSLEQRGENNPRAKLTEDDVREIRQMLAHGMSQAEIARKYGVGSYVVSRIKTGQRWGHVK
jgi:group I intron endonuclease